MARTLDVIDENIKEIQKELRAILRKAQAAHDAEKRCHDGPDDSKLMDLAFEIELLTAKIGQLDMYVHYDS
jgi:hypothetical protein